MKGPPRIPQGTEIIPWSEEFTQVPDLVRKKGEFDKSWGLLGQSRKNILNVANKIDKTLERKRSLQQDFENSQTQMAKLQKKKGTFPSEMEDLGKKTVNLQEALNKTERELIQLCAAGIKERREGVRHKEKLIEGYKNWQYALKEKKEKGTFHHLDEETVEWPVHPQKVFSFNYDNAFFKAINQMAPCEKLAANPPPPPPEPQPWP